MIKISVEVEGVVYNTLAEAAKFYNIKRPTLYARISKGWTVEEAFELYQKTIDCNGIVYKITNTKNSKVYIGVTVSSVSNRFSQHKHSCYKGEKTKLYIAMRSIGIENFSIKVIKRAKNSSELRKLEIVFINKYNSIKDGYNERLGGGLFGSNIGTITTYNGEEFKNDRLLAKRLGIKPATLFTRRSRGTKIDAEVKGKIPVLFKGIEYPSKASLARELNISCTTLKNRIAKNMRLDAPLMR